MRKPMSLILLSLFLSTAAPAKVFCASLYTADAKVQSLSRFGLPQAEAQENLPELFRLLVWNVKKGEIKGMVEDFRTLSQDANLVLLQEMVDRPDLASGISLAQPHLSWGMAQAFKWDRSEYYTGVATGSTAKPLRETSLISPVVEPIAKTPKSLLVTEYKLGNTGLHTLVALNLHAINFVTQASFKSHMDQVVQVIKSHRGPLVVAGDFNTWSLPRLQYMESVLQALGLKNLNVGVAGWTFPFDHIFVRGLRLEQSIGLSRIESSDHKPLMVDLVYDPNFNLLTP